MQFKSFMEALKGNQHKLDKNKNGKLDAHDFKLLRKEEECDDIEEDVDRIERSDYKINPSGRKSHKEITFKNGESETDEIKAKSQREEIELDEAAKGHTIEAHGIKGMKRTPWRQTFKHSDHLNDWAEKNDAEVYGTRDLEGVKKGKASSVKEEKSISDAEMKKREDYVKGMKKNISSFKDKYGDRAKDVMYATATKMAMEEVDSATKELNKANLAAKHAKEKESLASKHEQEKEQMKESSLSTMRADAERRAGSVIKPKSPTTKAAPKAGSMQAMRADAERRAGSVSKSSVREETEELDESNHMQMANDIEVYAKKSGGIDKNDMMKVASMIKRGDMQGAKKYALTLDTDPKDWLMTKMGLAEETDQISEAMINGREYASQGVMHPDHTKHNIHQVTGRTVDFYAHGTGDKMQGKVTKNDGKSVHIQAHKGLGDGKLHKFKVTSNLPKQNNEELQMQEKAPVAPSLMKHRIGVTVSDPNHTMASKRSEKIQKFAVVTHSDNKEGAKAVAEKFYKKKGLRVHDSHHAGMVKEQKDPPFDMPYKKAEAPKTDKSGAVHSPMSRARHLAQQAMKKQVKEDLYLEDFSLDELLDFIVSEDYQQLDELSKSTVGSYIKKATGSVSDKSYSSGEKKLGDPRGLQLDKEVEKRRSNISKAVNRLTKEGTVPKGHHKMPDGTIMKDSDHKKEVKEDVDQIDELSKATLGSYAKKASHDIRAKTRGSETAASAANYSMTPGKSVDPEQKRKGMAASDQLNRKAVKRVQGVTSAVNRLTREDTDFDEDGNLVSEKLTFSDFIDKLNEQLLEYETKNGVYRHKGSYGSSYQGDDEESLTKRLMGPASDAPKRGRGRPAGSSGASYKPRSVETKAAAAAKAAATKAANKK